MSARSKIDNKNVFVSGARPTETQFADLIDSYQDFSELLTQISTALATETGFVQLTSASATAHGLIPIEFGGTGAATVASALKSLSAVTAEAGGGFGVITSANVWTNENTWISSATGSAENPAMNLDRRAPGLGGQALGVLRFKGRDSLNASTTYAKFGAHIVSTSAGGETGRMEVITTVSGNSAARFLIAGGMYSLAASGGDKGIGTINVSAYHGDTITVSAAYVGGEQVEATNLATEQATTSGTVKTFVSPFPTTTGVRVMMNDVSINGTTDEIGVRIGPTAGIVSTGYDTECGWPGTDAIVNSTTEFTLTNDIGSSDDIQGVLHLYLANESTNLWHAAGFITHAGNTYDQTVGNISLAGPLTDVALVVTGTPTNAFNAGAVNVRWYGY